MKWILIMVSIFFISCKGPFYINTQNYTVNHMDLDTAWKIVSSYKYIEEKPGQDYW